MQITHLFRFRLRTLLGLVTLIALMLGWYAFTATQYAAELAAIEKVRVFGNGAKWVCRDDEPNDWGGPGLVIQANLVWKAPDWLRGPLKRWNAPVFYRTHQVYLMGPAFDDRVIPPLASLRHLKTIRLVDTSISPEDLQTLREKIPQAEVVQ